jgi:hypothetical protein
MCTYFWNGFSPARDRLNRALRRDVLLEPVTGANDNGAAKTSCLTRAAMTKTTKKSPRQA